MKREKAVFQRKLQAGQMMMWLFVLQEMKIHPKAVKGDKNQVGAPMPGTVLCKYFYILKILQ